MVTDYQLLWIAASYLLGCINASYYLVRYLKKQDIRHFGSGNAGARNTGRLLGRAGFAVTLTMDLAKGIVVVWISQALHFGEVIVVLAAIAVVAGHIWPVQLQFRGGKGIAVFLGVLLHFDVRTVAIIILIFLILYAFFRRFTITGLAALWLSPFVMFFLGGKGNITVAGTLIITALVIYAHRKNIHEEFKRDVSL